MRLVMASIYGAILKKPRQELGCDYDIPEIDEDLYVTVLQAAKQAQSAA